MKKISIADTTLRCAENGKGASLSFKNKVEIAKQLDKIRADAIEIAPNVDDKADALLAGTICSVVKHSIISATVSMNVSSVESTWNAISRAEKPRLHVIVPVSPVNMEYHCKMKPDKVLELIGELISESVRLCPDTEFTAEDATRAEPEFLYTVLKTAVAHGAKTVTLCDSVGVMFPEEFRAFVESVLANVPELSGVTLSVQCGNEMGMASACVFASIGLGVAQIKTAINGVSAPTLEEIGHVFHLRGDRLDVECSLGQTELHRAARRIESFVDGHRRETNMFDSVTDTESVPDIVLDKNADISEVWKAVRSLGYEISDDDLGKVYESFVRVARKKAVNIKELEAIIASSAMQVEPTFKLISYVITSGNVLTPMAHITLESHGDTLQGVSVGDGPIDASFLAIEQIIGHHYELDDFQILSVTQGHEAVGDALVKLRSNGLLYSGKGISTDIIGASIRAYVNALNKIVAQEGN